MIEEDEPPLSRPGFHPVVPLGGMRVVRHHTPALDDISSLPQPVSCLHDYRIVVERHMQFRLLGKTPFDTHLFFPEDLLLRDAHFGLRCLPSRGRALRLRAWCFSIHVAWGLM